MRATCTHPAQGIKFSSIFAYAHLPPRGGNEQLKVNEGEWGRRALTGRGNCPEVCFSELSSVQLADSFQTSRGFHVNLPLLQTFPSPLIPRIVEQTVKTRTITPPSLKNRLVRILFVRSDRSIRLFTIRDR